MKNAEKYAIVALALSISIFFFSDYLAIHWQRIHNKTVKEIIDTRKPKPEGWIKLTNAVLYDASYVAVSNAMQPPTREANDCDIKDLLALDWLARSNAAYLKLPPKGWTIACDGSGKYAARDESGWTWARGTLIKGSFEGAIQMSWFIYLHEKSEIHRISTNGAKVSFDNLSPRDTSIVDRNADFHDCN